MQQKILFRKPWQPKKALRDLLLPTLSCILFCTPYFHWLCWIFWLVMLTSTD